MKIFAKVIPNSKKPEIIDLGNGHFKVKVDAPAEDGKANKRLIEILAGHFNVSKGDVIIIRGAKSREKTIVLASPTKRNVL